MGDYRQFRRRGRQDDLRIATALTRAPPWPPSSPAIGMDDWQFQVQSASKRLEQSPSRSSAREEIAQRNSPIRTCVARRSTASCKYTNRPLSVVDRADFRTYFRNTTRLRHKNAEKCFRMSSASRTPLIFSPATGTACAAACRRARQLDLRRMESIPSQNRRLRMHQHVSWRCSTPVL